MRRSQDPALAIADARRAGGWLVWTGAALAVLWWIASGVGAIAFFDLPAQVSANLPIVIAGTLAAFIPGALILTAGYMARENARSSAANALVMRAAARLLTPSRELTDEASDLAGQLQKSAESVDRAMSHAISAMKALAGELGDERMRLESVSYASADNARDLSQRLGKEREAMETLARELKQQTETITDTIPRQSRMMVEAAKLAGEEMGKADDALEQKLAAMQQAGAILQDRLMSLDHLAGEAAKRTESITYAVTRVEEKLDQSRKTVDAALRAGEMAAAAATTTGDSLKDAVSSALSGAREASNQINAETRRAAEEAAATLAVLRNAGESASESIRTAGMAARAETDMIERRIDLMTAQLGRIGAPAKPASTPPESAPRSFAPNSAKPSIQTSGLNGHANGHADVSVPPRKVDDELFEPRAGGAANGSSKPTAANPLMLRTRLLDPVSSVDDGFDPLDDLPEPAPQSTPRTNGTAPRPAEWRDILADIDQSHPANEPSKGPALPRDETADLVVERLISSGIQLPQTFRPKDKRKIAAAARKGERQRRSATLEAASRQVERVAQRLQGDRELGEVARDFIVMEEADALVALQETQKTGRNASQRLSAYLLIDAALG